MTELSPQEKAEIERIRAEKEKARKAACIVDAVDAVAQAAEGLASIKDGETIDEVRIAIMGLLRKAIHHVNEAV